MMRIAAVELSVVRKLVANTRGTNEQIFQNNNHSSQDKYWWYQVCVVSIKHALSQKPDVLYATAS
jgi:hypothetical protein